RLEFRRVLFRSKNKSFFIAQYNQQISQLNIQLNATNLLFDKIQQQVNYTKALIQADQKLMATGDVRVTDFVIAITNYLAAQNSYRQNFIGRLRIINQIKYWNQ